MVGVDLFCGVLNCVMSVGMYSSDEVKIMGIILVMFILIGMYVLVLL